MRGGGVGAHLPQKVISKEYTVNNENNTADNNKHAISLSPILDKKKTKKLVQSSKLNRKTQKKDPTTVGRALRDYAYWDQRSTYLSIPLFLGTCL